MSLGIYENTIRKDEKENAGQQRREHRKEAKGKDKEIRQTTLVS